MISSWSKDSLQRIVEEVFVLSVTVDAISWKRLNFASTLEVISFKDATMRLMQHSSSNITDVVFSDMTNRVLDISIRITGRRLIFPKRIINRSMFIGGTSVKSMSLRWKVVSIVFLCRTNSFHISGVSTILFPWESPIVTCTYEGVLTVIPTSRYL